MGWLSLNGPKSQPTYTGIKSMHSRHFLKARMGLSEGLDWQQQPSLKRDDMDLQKVNTSADTSSANHHPWVRWGYIRLTPSWNKLSLLFQPVPDACSVGSAPTFPCPQGTPAGTLLHLCKSDLGEKNLVPKKKEEKVMMMTYPWNTPSFLLTPQNHSLSNIADHLFQLQT